MARSDEGNERPRGAGLIFTVTVHRITSAGMATNSMHCHRNRRTRLCRRTNLQEARAPSIAQNYAARRTLQLFSRWLIHHHLVAGVARLPDFLLCILD